MYERCEELRFDTEHNEPLISVTRIIDSEVGRRRGGEQPEVSNRKSEVNEKREIDEVSKGVTRNGAKKRTARKHVSMAARNDCTYWGTAGSEQLAQSRPAKRQRLAKSPICEKALFFENLKGSKVCLEICNFRSALPQHFTVVCICRCCAQCPQPAGCVWKHSSSAIYVVDGRPFELRVFI